MFSTHFIHDISKNFYLSLLINDTLSLTSVHGFKQSTRQVKPSLYSPEDYTSLGLSGASKLMLLLNASLVSFHSRKWNGRGGVMTSAVLCKWWYSMLLQKGRQQWVSVYYSVWLRRIVTQSILWCEDKWIVTQQWCRSKDSNTWQ